MTKTTDTATFNTEKFEKARDEMKAKREDVHKVGRETYAKTGHMDPLVDVAGRLRLSHNAFRKDGEKFILASGIALPVWSGFDGTGSMDYLAGLAHDAQGEMHAMLRPIADTYQPQLSASVLQDVVDPERGGHPVFQQTQYEPDERIAKQIRMLVPDGGGGDEIEDYQLGVAYLAFWNDFDIATFYGLKGYGFIVADEIGRESVATEDVKRHLGHTLQSTMSTKAVAKLLAKKMHMFYIHLRLGNSHEHSPAWWQDKFGAGHVVVVNEPKLIAEVQAGLIYVYETPKPTADGLYEFLRAGGGNKRISKSSAAEIWSWYTRAGVEFGAQTKLPGYSQIPAKGSIFQNLRHQWPEGHPKFAENYVAETVTVENIETTSVKSDRPDWNRF